MRIAVNHPFPVPMAGTRTQIITAIHNDAISYNVQDGLLWVTMPDYIAVYREWTHFHIYAEENKQ